MFEGVPCDVNEFERLVPGVGVRLSVPVEVTELPPERVRVAVAVGLPTPDRLRVAVVEDVRVGGTARVRLVVVVGLRDPRARDRVAVAMAVAVAVGKARVRVPEAVRVLPALDRVAVTVGLVTPPRAGLTVGVGDTTALDRVAVTVVAGVRAEVPIGIWVFPKANRDTINVSNLICY